MPTNPELPLDENDKRRLVQRLVSHLQCLECGRPYRSEDFRPVHRWEDVWILGCHCQHCGVRSHVVIVMQLGAEPNLGSDLTLDELKDVDGRPPITADDVLDIHIFLREFEGDFEKFFAG